MGEIRLVPDGREKLQHARYVIFGKRVLDRNLGRLSVEGARADLTGKPLSLLETLLLTAAGDGGATASRTVVDYESLSREVWPERSPSIDEDPLACQDLIAHAVAKIRREFGDNSVIENFPRKGYRYVGPKPVLTESIGGKRLKASRGWQLVAVGVAGLLALSALALTRTQRPRSFNPEVIDLVHERLQVSDGAGNLLYAMPTDDWSQADLDGFDNQELTEFVDVDQDGTNELIVGCDFSGS